MINDGVLIEDHPVAGSNQFVVRNPSGNWPAPGGEHQYSNVVDTMACVSYSATHCIESQILYLTGQVINLSERFLAKMSGTTPQGNYQQKVVDTILKYGMVADEYWPEPTQFTWAEYYAPIPQAVIDRGQEFLKSYDVSSMWIASQDVALALTQSPLQVLIEATNPYHAQELINVSTVFDTYEPYEKPVKSSYDHLAIIINPKTNMNFVTQDYKGELRIIPDYLRAKDSAHWQDLCKALDIDPNAPIDEIIN